MPKQTCSCGQQVFLSMYGLLLTTGIKELSMKGITMQLCDQNCKS